jgi:predicted RNA polymerase sigma factor
MKYSDIPLPKAWPRRVKSAFINAVSQAHAAVTYSRAWCADSPIRRVQLAGQLDQARQEIALLREEVRIKDTRMAKIPPHHRPFFPPIERMAILALKAARGWNLAQTARAFLVEPATVAQWMKRLDEDGPKALVRTPVPVSIMVPIHPSAALAVLLVDMPRD